MDVCYNYCSIMAWLCQANGWLVLPFLALYTVACAILLIFYAPVCLLLCVCVFSLADLPVLSVCLFFLLTAFCLLAFSSSPFLLLCCCFLPFFRACAAWLCISTNVRPFPSLFLVIFCKNGQEKNAEELIFKLIDDIIESSKEF